MRKLVIATLAVVLAATFMEASDGPRFAAANDKVIIAIADPATGRALIPDGTVLPAGVRFFVHTVNAADFESADEQSDAGPGQELVFAYAPEAEFTQARRAIAGRRDTMQDGMPAFVASPEALGHRSSRDFDVAVDDTPTWFYLYFADGSYLAALRHYYDGRWGVSTMSYSAPGYYSGGSLTARQTSNLVWGPTGGPYFDPYAYSKVCTITSSGGSCQTMLPYVPSTGATVDSTGTINQRYGTCVQYPNQPPPEQPCRIIYTGTIRTTVPW
ncbi:MAG: hypothetical protein QOJ98_3546 [Acidobacteriota bacterium]|jgi:hypothetical protein|nr:hypothetical protein [Acidobacteriota bacterium]